MIILCSIESIWNSSELAVPIIFHLHLSDFIVLYPLIKKLDPLLNLIFSRFLFIFLWLQANDWCPLFISSCEIIFLILLILESLFAFSASFLHIQNLFCFVCLRTQDSFDPTQCKDGFKMKGKLLFENDLQGLRSFCLLLF